MESWTEPPPLCFALGLHNHQPLGNVEEAFRDNYENSYLPVLRLLRKHPSARVTLHYSGILLEWMEAHGREAVDLLRELAGRGQVELQTGGYYEPILPAIPKADRLGQIGKLTACLGRLLDVTPRGLWLAERVWEPHLARSLAEAGVEYTVVDDAHFHQAGITGGRLGVYYVTEEDGRTLKIFPTRKSLRYAVPFREPREAALEVRRTARLAGGLAVLHDDGEKFGGWPGTFETVHRHGWLERFFACLAEEGVRMVTLSEALDTFAPAGRVYLPCASYQEMMEWSGGFWRNYLARYPESNNLHKKMLHVSRKIRATRDAEAEEHLWRGQCNDAYWHGVFGGLYLTHLRTALYRELITAENLADRSLRDGDDKILLSVEDFDCDGRPEVLLSGHRLNAYFDPDDGGTLFELDWRPLAFNLIDTLARRPETYHKKILSASEEEDAGNDGPKTIHERSFRKEEGLERLLRYDGERRSCLRDRFFSPEDEGDEPVDLGTLATTAYRYEVLSEHPPSLRFVAVGRTGGKEGGSIEIEKTVTVFPAGRITATYRVRNLEESHAIRIDLGSEWNLNFLGGSDPERRYWAPDETEAQLDSRGRWKNAGRFGIRDLRLGLEVDCACRPTANVQYYPVETLSQSERGYDRIYQASCLIPRWTMHLGPGDSWLGEISVTLRDLGDKSGPDGELRTEKRWPAGQTAQARK